MLVELRELFTENGFTQGKSWPRTAAIHALLHLITTHPALQSVCMSFVPGNLSVLSGGSEIS